MKRGKIMMLLTSAALVGSLAAGPAFAFNDITDTSQQKPIQALKDRGVVSGVDEMHFMPQGTSTYAESVVMLVKGLGLNIDNIRFIKKPEASDYFTAVHNDSWYAEAFIIAQLNGLPIPKDVDPNGTITREQFADLVIHALDRKGSFPLIKMLIVLEDRDQVDPQLNASVQAILLHKIAPLGEDRKFYPKRELTRGEAAVWVYNTIRLVEAHNGPAQPIPQEEVTLSVEKVNEQVNKVVLSRGQKPTAGYGIAITAIQFGEDGTAVISYQLTDPAPDSFQAAVVTEPKAETYISSGYKPTLHQAPTAQPM